MRSNKIIKTDVIKYLKIAAIIFVLLLGGGRVLAAETENLLSVEFNNEVYIPDSLLNSSAECKLKSGYLEISPNWANTGYKLKSTEQRRIANSGF